MTETVLTIPRKLAIAILHEAQIAQPESIRGWVQEQGGVPARYHHGEAAAGCWARLCSVPLAPAVPQASDLAAGGLHLLISLNTKGVLEMRAWELRAGQPAERVIKVQD